MFRRLKAFAVVTLLWGFLGGFVMAAWAVVTVLSSGASLGGAVQAFSYFFLSGALLGLGVGAAFALVLAALRSLMPEDRVPTWAAALLGGIAAFVGGWLVLVAASSMLRTPGFMAILVASGSALGGGIGAVANRAALQPVREPASLPEETDSIRVLGEKQ
jgi:MFS family permease